MDKLGFTDMSETLKKAEKYTTKTEPSNEQVAEVLGFVRMDNEEIQMMGRPVEIQRWRLPGEKLRFGLPDFTRDLNTLKYVWPALVSEIAKIALEPTPSEYKFTTDLKQIAFDGLNSPNPAMYFATKLMELKEKV